MVERAQGSVIPDDSLLILQGVEYANVVVPRLKWRIFVLHYFYGEQRVKEIHRFVFFLSGVFVEHEDNFFSGMSLEHILEGLGVGLVVGLVFEFAAVGGNAGAEPSVGALFGGSVLGFVV